jgi:hypothetical protein
MKQTRQDTEGSLLVFGMANTPSLSVHQGAKVTGVQNSQRKMCEAFASNMSLEFLRALSPGNTTFLMCLLGSLLGGSNGGMSLEPE